MTTHREHVFSITVHTDDLAVVNCLRALSKYSQKTGNNNIPWGGTKDRDWESHGHEVTFYFSDLSELKRLLPLKLWREASRDDARHPRPAR